MDIISLFIFCAVVSGISIHSAIYVMHNLSIVDCSSEKHKLHDVNTPFVGGVGVLVALCIAFSLLALGYSETLQKWLVLGLCSIIIFVTGFIDDSIKLSYKSRFIIQTIVACLMVLIGGVVLTDLGGLLWGQPLQLAGWFAIAFTIFAVIGGINAVNMIDGLDGLSGSISLSSLLLIGIAALINEDHHNLVVIVALAGGVVGFLYHNLRYASKRYARVFLGDNGSMLLGFILAWLLVDLSQKPNPAITPVTAIWLFSIPLLDTLTVMLRRISLGQSPFMPDRYHLHHLFQKSGFFVTEITYTITFLHLLLGAIGLTGLYLGIPEFIMLLGFFLVFLGYFGLTMKPWRFVSLLRHLRVIILGTRLGLAPIASCSTFYGNYDAKDCEILAKRVNEELEHDTNFSIRIFEQSSVRPDWGKRFAITLNLWLAKEDCASEAKLQQYIASLQQRLGEQRGIQLRRLMARDKDFDLRAYSSGSAFGESLNVSRRGLGAQALAFEVTCKV